MTDSGKQKLRSLLFGGETTLVNLKLFPGTKKNLSADCLGSAAADVLGQAMRAWNDGVPSRAPSTGMEKRPLTG